jgi:hypothetical protein
MQIGAAAMEKNMALPQNIKIEPSHQPASPSLATYPKEMKLMCSRDMCTPTFIVTAFTIAKSQPKCSSMDKGIKKMREREKKKRESERETIQSLKRRNSCDLLKCG